jgi:taurine dioxygenase
MSIELRPVQGSFGIEVVGAPADLAMSEADFAMVEAAWYRGSFLLFHGLAMTPAQQVAFTRRFGPLHILVEQAAFNLPDQPEVLVVSNVEEGGRALGLKRAGWGWHSDGEDKVLPNAGSFLYAHEVPPEGGDTLFADCYAAYAALPDDNKCRIAGRRACFSRVRMHAINYPHLEMNEVHRQTPDSWHPIARRHPRTGRTALYIGRWAVEIEGMGPAEGTVLIDELRSFAIRPEFVYRHRWRVGDAILWDNRCMQHCAMEFDDARYRRRMHRTTIEGEPPLLA